MSVPFTIDQFLEVFTKYNQTIWPAQILLNAVALSIVFLAFQRGQNSNRAISIALSALWLWTGIVYHLLFFTSINPAAYLFGAFFIMQGILFLSVGVIKNRISYAISSDIRGIVGSIFVLYALLSYPLLGFRFGHVYPGSPTFGAPCPATIFTFGVLLWTGGTIPRYLLVIPALWSIIGFSAALNFGMKEDVGLLIAGVIGSLLLFIGKKSDSKV